MWRWRKNRGMSTTEQPHRHLTTDRRQPGGGTHFTGQTEITPTVTCLFTEMPRKCVRAHRVSFVCVAFSLSPLSILSNPTSALEVGIARADNFYFTPFACVCDKNQRQDRPQRLPSWAPKRGLGIILWYRRVRLTGCLFSIFCWGRAKE